MMHRGIATFGLDEGRCPKWLFERMTNLSRQAIEIIVAEYGADEFIKRLGDPAWFQSLGTVLAFDWNASGLTTILTAALKEAVRGRERELGIFVCGGKGRTSRKTPEEIRRWGSWLTLPEKNSETLVYNSKMAAKVDSALVQDGFQLYHHAFFFSKTGAWTVVQQGMNTKTASARRYHWYSANMKDLINEPHTGIMSSMRYKKVLDLTAQASMKNRNTSLALTGQGFGSLWKDIRILYNHSTSLNQTLALKFKGDTLTSLNLEQKEFTWHPVVEENFFESPYLKKILDKVCGYHPKSYEEMVSLQGVGAKTVRALTLVAEVLYGAKPSYQDPARYSFAFGGKDATPYPVDRPTYDASLKLIAEAVRRYQTKSVFIK
ncbi:MAG: hypothetical protein UX65_C0012G0006 [Parcubacteria group bacterium GW2011_GWB1_46_8]|nr:MAG: hypothetical protein UX14_C0030G0002 [Parcubacteria group bacterium GW2011_GWF1_45_5]KKU10188.1 MAG: hypothetical protein UX15_C0036G0006 [Parcubacteria group bacterium GW2011_GWA1_45_7]KKU43506.1 MAG: hypothetical protein UX61_C0017G0006 [Parcubacteria group bacterium GW2011_GWA2_46_7]KKU46000.1 MAG: hypothetical protein UX65_C0012G0006 [Parcubacteria group bacterium GW2011_GWB1_46_8]KKU47240.1 MAG: hypothetical protein UX66_C0020G0015 [Parcubacteria group bacterium GW2011_GWF2_46_8]